jgi:hypothetical protein
VTSSIPSEPGVRTRQVVERVREHLLLEVERSFREASLSGLCADGALEVALGHARNLSLDAIIASEKRDHPDENT